MDHLLTYHYLDSCVTGLPCRRDILPHANERFQNIDHAGERPRKQRENLKAPNGICKLYPLGRLIAELSSVTLVDIVARLGVGAASGV